MSLINEAIIIGARKYKACKTIGISIRTFQRWVENGKVIEDMRPIVKRPKPHNKLSKIEQQQILDTCNSVEFADLTPNQIVPELADRGVYIGSEATFYRILKEYNQVARRRRSKHNRHYHKPDVQKASAPNQVWTWDISYMPSVVKGMHFYLYMIIDIYSRKIVGADVYAQELGEHAAELLQRAVWKEKCVNNDVVLHSDNGAPMRSFTMLAKMQDLGVITSYSRPRVSNDNPYSESLFKTVKYCPQWPKNGFESIENTRIWVDEFVNWYNCKHKHSGIKYVTPTQRHQGLDIDILLNRKTVYQKAKEVNPGRWSQETRNWDFIDEVCLNPDKKAA